MTYKPVPTVTDLGIKKVPTVDRSVTQILELQLLELKIINMYLSHTMPEKLTSDDLDIMESLGE